LGLARDEIRDYVPNEGLDGLWPRLQIDDSFVRDFELQALRESLNADYRNCTIQVKSYKAAD